jgi:BirA family transcriptional regulator, biotin operon repressor / biotin---[acetyl-CoA-carboxylase] ligase
MAAELSAGIIGDGLQTKFVGRNILYYPSVISTMSLARGEAQKGAIEGTVIVAGEQTAGIGRLERIWHSPPGNVSLSLVLRPKLEELTAMVMLAALAVADAIRRVTGLEADIKWPNDLLLGGKKVCGILMTSEVHAGVVDHIVIGIGLNVNMKVADFPDIRDIAASLADELGREVSLPEMLRALFEELERQYSRLPDKDAIFQQWQGKLVTLGRRVTATWGTVSYQGVVESVSPDGSLTLRQDDGIAVTVVAGDVILR